MPEREGDILRRYRLLAGMSQRALSEEFRVTERTISSWECNTRVIRLSPLEMVKLCAILNCTLEDLAGIPLEARMNGSFDWKQIDVKEDFL